MSTGKSTIEEEKYLSANCPSHQRQYLAAMTSSDVLLRNLRHGPDIFQVMFGDLIQRQRVTRDFSDLCSVLNLAPSREFTLKERTETVLNQLKDGIHLGARDLVFLFFDNVGFKILGRQASYDQWIVINIVVVPEADLKAAGFYNDEASDNQQMISREPEFYWDEEINDISEGGAVELAEKIVGIQEIDIERLAHCILENIRFALVYHKELRLDNQQHVRVIPRFDRIVSEATCVKMEDLMVNGHCTNIGGAAHTASHRSAVIPRNHIPDDINNELGGDNLTQSVVNAGVVETGGRNKYEINNTKMQVEHMDLSKTTTVKGIADYMVRSQMKQLTKCVGGWLILRRRDTFLAAAAADVPAAISPPSSNPLII
jgi:hypothetical protein